MGAAASERVDPHRRATGPAGIDLPAALPNTNRAAAGTLHNGILTVHLVVGLANWHPLADSGPALTVQAFGVEGGDLQISGPLIRVRQGTAVHATIRNATDSALVLYGFHARPGSPDDTIQVPAGGTREVRFDAGRAGTYYYWGTTTHSDLGSREWLDSQLSGALIVDPPGAPAEPDDRVFVLGVWFQEADSTGPEPHLSRVLMTINGKAWPYTERLTYTQGDSVRWRWVNSTGDSHPMHLHGVYYEVDSHGSWAADTTYRAAQRRLVVTQLMLSGTTMTMRWAPARAGNWIFHCHFAFHVSTLLYLAPPHHHGDPHDALTGMSGLVLGITATPRAGATAPLPHEPAPRALRLLVQSRPHVFGAFPGYAYLLQRGAEPRPDSFAFPSPMLVLERGKPVRITVVNHLDEATAVHWHGIELESYPDGVPGWSGTPGRLMPPIAPGDSFVAEFTPPRAGTFIYHAHVDEPLQIRSGLNAPLIILEPGRTLDPTTDHVIMVASAGASSDSSEESPPGLVNGQSSPAPIDMTVGQTHRFRLISLHPDFRVTFTLRTDTSVVMWRPVAKDGADLPPAQRTPRRAFLMTGPGETADFTFTPTQPGDLRLEVRTAVSGWYIPVPIHVHAAARRATAH